MKNIINSIKSLKDSKNKLKMMASIITILFVASMLTSVVPVQAQENPIHGQAPTQTGYIGPETVPAGVTVNYTISDIAFLSVSPNPIGVNQQALVNMWITFPSGEGKFMNGYVVTITHPDGTTETVNLQSYVADGTSWFTYQPSVVGIYSFQFAFKGEYFPAGYYSAGNYSATFVNGWIYNPSDYCEPAVSQIMNLTVQQALVSSWQSPLPTNYWSRPIQPNNREWTSIGGNFPPIYENIVGYKGTNSWNENWYGSYIPSVNTPHILWSQQGAIAGLIGNDQGSSAGQQATLASPSTIAAPNVIYQGRCYATVTKAMNGLPSQSYAECYDLQTGQIYYDLPTATGGVTPQYISYSAPASGEADLSYSVELFTISGSFLYKVNPNTGAVTNITLPNFGGSNSIANFYYRNGYMMSFVYNSSTNAVYDGVAVTLAFNGWILNWTTLGGSSTAATATRAQIASAFNSRIVGNLSVTLPESFRTIYEPNFGYGYGAYDPVTGISITQHRFIYGGFYGGAFIATSFVNSTNPIGGMTHVLWNITNDKSDISDPYRPTNAWCENGVYSYEMERGFIQARSEFTGAILWNTTIMDANLPSQYPWGEFWMYDEAAYNGIIYATGYTGTWALNETTGVIIWHNSDPAVPFETPYTAYTTNGTYENEYSDQDIRVIGGGTSLDASAIVYVSNNEHTPTLPPERGWGLRAINATTGETLWKIMGTRMQVGAASDGYIVATSNYDGHLYVLGKGTSATTVSAPQTAITANTPVIISGTVMDTSKNQPGTPAVSDASMATWMDYLNLQMPLGGIYGNATITGVPVSLDAVDPNGNLVHIGTATSDQSGTYSFVWTPATTGSYHISAYFAGSNAYGSSSSETAAVVMAAPATATPTATPVTGLATAADLMTFIVIAIIVILIAIAVLGVLILRKH